MKKKLVSSIPRNGLVGEWLLDGNSLDTNDGTKNNGTATNVTYVSTDKGYQKQTGSFNGTSKITVPHSASINITGSISISAWVKPNTTQENPYCAYVEKSYLNSYYFGQANVSGSLSFFYGGVQLANDTLITPLNKWSHILVSYDRATTTGKIYVNGVEKSSSTSFNPTVAGNSTSLYIGTQATVTEKDYNGQIQGVRIYNRALSQQEIQTLYQEGLRMFAGGSDNILSSAIAYYDFNGDANDVIGGNNGTVTGATLTTDRFGVANRAYSFNGLGGNTTTSRIIIGSVANISTGFTISSLVNTNSLAYIQSIFGIDDSMGGPEISILTNGTVRLNKGYQASVLNPATVLSINTWYNIVATYNGTTASIYVNGTLIGSTTTTAFSNVNKRIGSSGGDNYSFNGKIDEVIIYNKALSDGEVKQLYEASSNKYIYPFKKTFPLNLNGGKVLHLAGDTSGTTALDISGNGNNGTMVNSPIISRFGQHKVFRFNGTNQLIQGTHGLGTGNITFYYSSWIYVSSSQTRGEFLSIGNKEAINQGIHFSVRTSGQIFVDYSVNAGFNTSTSLVYGRWNKIDIVKVGDNISITINGIKENFNKLGLNVITNTLFISTYGDPTAYFNGFISNPILYNKTLTPVEIQQLYYSTYIQ